MSRSILGAWILVSAAGITCIWMAAHRAMTARARARVSQSEFTLVVQQVRELADLDTAQPNRPPRPAAGLAPRITATLARGGSSASCLASFMPDAQVVSAEVAGLKRQRAGLTLASLTLPQLGAFLDEWRRAEPAWTVTAIDVSPSGSAAATPGGDLPLRITMTIETVFAEADPPVPPPSASEGAR